MPKKTKQNQASATQSALNKDLSLIAEARHHDPFNILGLDQKNQLIRFFLPHAESVFLLINGEQKALERQPDSDFFEYKKDKWAADNFQPVTETHYQLCWHDKSGYEHIEYYPYSFAPQISNFDIHLFTEGKLYQCYKILGSHRIEIDAIQGTLFATWAPNAQRVSVIGDFNQWDGRCHPM
ncbi:MAG: hypothetical protein KAI17_15690, partial [Thiotrichaceae bacterium]|nr:hypothetical protein [Thiotrichaceae bacterium]